MNLKIFLTLCLIPTLAFAQTRTPTPKPKVLKAKAPAVSLLKKKTTPLPKTQGDLPTGTILLPKDASYYAGLNEFLSNNYAMRDRRTADEKAWGTALGLASAASAGIAGVQFLDSLGKKEEKPKNPDKPK